LWPCPADGLWRDHEIVLDAVLDVFRLRQYFGGAARLREVAEGTAHDLGFLDDIRRALVTLPTDRYAPGPVRPFPPPEPFRSPVLEGRRVGLVATGGSGALASIVGVARALEEADASLGLISVCSGSALFGFPLGAGLPAEEVAAFVCGLRPADYIDPDWRKLALLAPTLGRGFAGVLRGDRLEESYRRLLGDLTLGDLPIPTYAPLWNIEENRVEYLGPGTHPDLPVARAVRMAVSLPLFLEPVDMDGSSWCDGGIVDIFPVHPVLDRDQPAVDVIVAVNGFYPAEFAGEDATGWADRSASILYVASQVRTCQQIELARENLARLRRHHRVVMLHPVPYAEVRGVGFYRQFLATRDWPTFMRAGRSHARRALGADGEPR
jgi:NTE family protein